MTIDIVITFDCGHSVTVDAATVTVIPKIGDLAWCPIGGHVVVITMLLWVPKGGGRN